MEVQADEMEDSELLLKPETSGSYRHRSRSRKHKSVQDLIEDDDTNYKGPSEDSSRSEPIKRVEEGGDTQSTVDGDVPKVAANTSGFPKVTPISKGKDHNTENREPDSSGTQKLDDKNPKLPHQPMQKPDPTFPKVSSKVFQSNQTPTTSQQQETLNGTFQSPIKMRDDPKPSTSNATQKYPTGDVPLKQPSQNPGIYKPKKGSLQKNTDPQPSGTGVHTQPKLNIADTPKKQWSEGAHSKQKIGLTPVVKATASTGQTNAFPNVTPGKGSQILSSGNAQGESPHDAEEAHNDPVTRRSDSDEEEHTKQTEPSDTRYQKILWPNYNAYCSMIQGVLMVCSGVCCVVFDISIALVAKIESQRFQNVVPGIWGGSMLIVAGSVTLAAAVRRSTWLIVTSVVVCITAGCSSVATIAIKASSIDDINNKTVLLNVPDKSANIYFALSSLIIIFVSLGCITSIVNVGYASVVCRDKSWAYTSFADKFSGRSSIILGVLQITCGAAFVVLTSAALGYFEKQTEDNGNTSRHQFFYALPGFWCGLIIIASGVVSVISRKRPYRRLLVTNVVLAIFVILTSLAGIGFLAKIIYDIGRHEDDFKMAEKIDGLSGVMIGLCGLACVQALITIIRGSAVCRPHSLREKFNRIAPLPFYPESQVRPLDSEGASAPGRDGEPMYMDLTRPYTVDRPGITPMHAVQPGQIMYLRAPEGHTDSVLPFRLQEQVVLGYQYALIQQSIIPMQPVNQLGFQPQSERSRDSQGPVFNGWSGLTPFPFGAQPSDPEGSTANSRVRGQNRNINLDQKRPFNIKAFEVDRNKH